MTADHAVERRGRRVSLPDEIVGELREQILNGVLMPGTRIAELDVARQFGSSQAPVREAFSRLREQGLLISLPNRGTFVSSVSIDDARSAYEMRCALDPCAVRATIGVLAQEDFEFMEQRLDEMAAAAARGDLNELTRADLQFHGLLYRRSRSRLMASTWELIEDAVRKFVGVAGAEYMADEELSAVVDMHRNLLELIRRGDAEAVIAEMRRQLAVFWDRIDEFTSPVVDPSRIFD